MFCAAAEESAEDLMDGRGDAYCGMLNASYNLKLRNVKVYIPEYPVGTADECADMIHEFMPIARTIIGLKSLKIISFGPRPLNFLACNAPIKPLYDLGVEIEENSRAPTSLRRSISTRATRVSRRSSKTWKKSSARAT